MPVESPSLKNPREQCEALLRAERQDRIDKAILPSEVAVIDRLLARGLELTEAYGEIHAKLHERPPALKVFFEQLFYIAAFGNPDTNAKARRDRAKLIEVNRRIDEIASQLAHLLTERTRLKNHSGFSCDTFYHPVDVIHKAAEGNYSYGQWVKGKLESLRCQFDLKYWPSLSELAVALAEDAAAAVPQPHDAVTDAGTEGLRPSLADSFKAFYVTLEESMARNHGFLPDTFELTDRSTAILVSCALGLDAEQTVDAGFVKRLRQRQRAKGRQV
jgi:hypothetical protein